MTTRFVTWATARSAEPPCRSGPDGDGAPSTARFLAVPRVFRAARLGDGARR